MHFGDGCWRHMRASSLKREMWATCAAIINLAHLHHYFSKLMSELFYCISDWMLHHKVWGDWTVSTFGGRVGVAQWGRSALDLHYRIISSSEDSACFLHRFFIVSSSYLHRIFIVSSCKDCRHLHTHTQIELRRIHTNWTETYPHKWNWVIYIPLGLKVYTQVHILIFLFIFFIFFVVDEQYTLYSIGDLWRAKNVFMWCVQCAVFKCILKKNRKKKENSGNTVTVHWS